MALESQAILLGWDLSEYFAYGYHATSRPAANEIIRSGFVASRNDYDWIGCGVYFFQDAPMYARDWCTNYRRTERVGLEDCVVLRCEVRYRDWIDLCDSAWMSQLRGMADLVPAGITQDPFLSGASATRHWFDYQLIELTVDALEQKGVSVRAVRSPFLEGMPVAANSHFHDCQHVQIAVRDTSILGPPEVFYGSL